MTNDALKELKELAKDLRVGLPTILDDGLGNFFYANGSTIPAGEVLRIINTAVKRVDALHALIHAIPMRKAPAKKGGVET